MREPRQVARRHDVTLLGPAARVLAHARAQADLAAAFGHLRRERFLAAAEPLGDDDAGVVARLHDDPAQQVLDRDPFADLDEHLRAALAPGLFADQEGVVERQGAFGEAVEHHVHRHDLAHRRRRHEIVGVLFEQHRAGRFLDQNRLAREDFQRRRRPRPGERRDKAQHDPRNGDATKPSESDHDVRPWFGAPTAINR